MARDDHKAGVVHMSQGYVPSCPCGWAGSAHQELESAEWEAADHDNVSVKNPVARQFGMNLRRARKAANLSQDELAELTGVHRTEISLLERGLREPRLETLAKLTHALEVTLGELAKGIKWTPPELPPRPSSQFTIR